MAGAIEPAPIEPSDGLRDENMDWRERLICSRGGSRQVYIVVSGLSGAGNFLPIAARRRIVDHIRTADPAGVSGSVAAGPRKAAVPLGRVASSEECPEAGACPVAE